MSTASASTVAIKPSPDGDPALHELQDEIIERFAELAAMLALPRSVGQIYGLLFTATRPLSFTDIVERLDLSKGSVSQGIKALHDVGAIRPAEGPDWRRDHFVAETALRALLGAYMAKSIQPQLQQGVARLDAMRARHRGTLRGRNGEGRLLLKRLEQLRAWHRKGAALLPLVTKFLG